MPRTESTASASLSCDLLLEFAAACNKALAPLGYSARPASVLDEKFLTELAVERLAPEFAGTGIESAALAALLTMQAHAQAASYAAAYPAAFHVIVVDPKGQPAGRLFADRTRDSLRLVDIVLHPRARSSGLGTVLIRALQCEAARAALPVRLSVVAASPALRLYSRLGFSVTSGDGVRIQMEWTP